MARRAAAEVMAQGAEEPAPWNPTGITAKAAPTAERPLEDLRWRPPREAPQVPEDQRERTQKAVVGQCLHARMPGYTGFIPSANAEHIFGHTSASVGHAATFQQSRQQLQRSATLLGTQGQQSEAVSERSRASTPTGQAPRLPADHPLGGSRAEMLRGHWVPTIPGYSGHIPGKHAENICGGGIIQTCRMAGRAIAERTPLPEAPPAVELHDGARRHRVAEYYHGQNRGDGLMTEKQRLAAGVREHCSRQIPGYTGHVPRLHGESIHGATSRTAGLIAADYCDDRIFNPQDHGQMCCAPQAPRPRQLRL